MFLIYKYKGQHQAVPIRADEKWNFHKVQSGRQEVRIVLRVRGRRHLLYTTRDLTARYPGLTRANLTLMCDEMIGAAADSIERNQECIDFPRIAEDIERKYHRRWCEQGVVTPTLPEETNDRPENPQAQQLVAHVRVEFPDVVIMETEPPTDVEQEELPY